MGRIYLATSNPGKIREFREAAQALSVRLEPLPGFDALPPAIEDGVTFEENARKKAEHYSRYAPEELLLAEDSGLAVDALHGAPGVYSARYAAMLQSGAASEHNSGDADNNLALIHQLERLPGKKFAGKYASVIALARNGRTLVTFTGEVHGELLTAPRGTQGFGYDPLFFYPALGRTFAELPLELKRRHSHRGNAFRSFLEWYQRNAQNV
ncbi:MAG TPA: non-canonical purine NTP pyrophosphatase [Candidatus Angelobacter sp.]|nr:non-canonical purine NTP pyrophosphatase [Candidatus Angelobacter sp.]